MGYIAVFSGLCGEQRTIHKRKREREGGRGYIDIYRPPVDLFRFALSP